MIDSPIDYLKQKLLLLENSKPVSSINELAVVRCPLCGDSNNVRHAHLYIGLKEIENTMMPVYDCKKCGFSGMLNIKLLRKLNIYDPIIDEYIKSLRRNTNIKAFGNNEFNLNYVNYKYPRPTSKDGFKVQYISDRLQIDFNEYENVLKYKVVFDFEKFLKMNNIVSPQVRFDKLPILSEQGIGFISEDKSSISIKNLKPELAGSRFNIIHLYQGKRVPHVYIPPCNVDILSQNPRIVISESSYNIICIKNYFFSDEDIDNIYASSSRKACLRTIIKTMMLTGFTHGKIDIFADNDSDFDIKYFEKTLKDLLETFDITIYINTDSKDFGVMPKEGEVFNFKTIKL